jgi:hypothetical protein
VATFFITHELVTDPFHVNGPATCIGLTRLAIGRTNSSRQKVRQAAHLSATVVIGGITAALAEPERLLIVKACLAASGTGSGYCPARNRTQRLDTLNGPYGSADFSDRFAYALAKRRSIPVQGR